MKNYFYLINLFDNTIKQKLFFISFIYSLGNNKDNRGICDCLGLLLKILLGPIGQVWDKATNSKIHHFQSPIKG